MQKADQEDLLRRGMGFKPSGLVGADTLRISTFLLPAFSLGEGRACFRFMEGWDAGRLREDEGPR